MEWPQIRVTLFRPPAAHPTRDEWRTLVEQIRLQEGEFASLDVVGTPLTLSARVALADSGFVRLDETAEGFRARRA